MEIFSTSTLDASPIDAVEPFTQELHSIVETMQKQLVEEVKILEGSEVPDYSMFRRELDEKTKKEPSELEAIQKEWKKYFRPGYLKTDPTQNSIQELNTSSVIVGLFNQHCPIRRPGEKCIESSMSSCEEKLENDGSEIDVTNECCDCTVPMISELTDGTLNEVK